MHQDPSLHSGLGGRRRGERHFAILGDGRAILLGEHWTPSGRLVDIQLKGAGPTALALVPAELPAPLMCAGLITFNALRNSGARPGDLVAVLGVGGLGQARPARGPTRSQ